MKISLNTLLNSIPFVSELLRIPIPANHSFKIKDLTKEIDKHHKTYNEQIAETQAKYGKKTESGYEIDAGSIDAFKKEQADLLDVEIEVTDIVIPFSAFEKPGLNEKGEKEYHAISGGCLRELDWLIH